MEYYYCHNPDCKKVTPESGSSEYCPICQSKEGEVIDQAECNRLVDAGQAERAEGYFFGEEMTEQTNTVQQTGKGLITKLKGWWHHD